MGLCYTRHTESDDLGEEWRSAPYTAKETDSMQRYGALFCMDATGSHTYIAWMHWDTLQVCTATMALTKHLFYQTRHQDNIVSILCQNRF